MGFGPIVYEVFEEAATGRFGPVISEPFDAMAAGQEGPVLWEVFDALAVGSFGPIQWYDLLEVKVSGVAGKQIKTGADGVATANLVDGVLSANAAGRAKMATGFFDEATATDKIGALALTNALLKKIGQTYDFSTATALRVPTPVVASDATTKAYVDNLINGLSWQTAVDLVYYIGTRTVAQINALTPAAGWTVVAGDAGTPTAGTSDALTVGDLTEFDGTSWKLIVDAVGGFPPNGTRAVIAWPAAETLYAPLTDGSDEGKIAQWDGTSLTPAAKTTSLDGWAVLCKGSPSNPPTAYNEGKTFAFAGVVPNGSWNQTGASIPFGSPVSVGTANAAGASGSAARADHVHDSPSLITSRKSLAPAVTAGNFSTTALTAGFTPALGTTIIVVVNGVIAVVGDGNRTDLGDFTNNVECYFSADGGATAKAMSSVVSGDTLYWNGTIAGYELAVTDEVSFHALAF